MNILDLIIVSFFAYNAVVGFRKGLSKIIFDLAGVIIGFMIGYRHYELVGMFLERQFALTPPYSLFVSFCSIWFLVYMSIALVGKFIEKVFSITGISIINRLLGSIFSMIFSSVKLLLLIVPLIVIQSPLAESSTLINVTRPVLISLFEDHIPDQKTINSIRENTLQTGTQIQNHVN